MSVTYEFKVDWDATDWMATADFSDAIDDISSYVKTHRMERGKNDELGNIRAGVLNLTLNNTDKRFSPPYSSSPLYGKMRPWLPVRGRATVDGTTETFYYGFISKIRVNAHSSVQEAYLYCTDGMDVLARQMVTQDGENRTTMSDGEAIGKLLDAAGWSSSKRSIDTDAGDVIEYPATTEF